MAQHGSVYFREGLNKPNSFWVVRNKNKQSPFYSWFLPLRIRASCYRADQWSGWSEWQRNNDTHSHPPFFVFFLIMSSFLSTVVQWTWASSDNPFFRSIELLIMTYYWQLEEITVLLVNKDGTSPLLERKKNAEHLSLFHLSSPLLN